MPPVMRTSVSLPDRSVTWMKVSLKEAKMWATPKTYSPSRTVGPRVTFSSLGSRVFFLPDMAAAVATATGAGESGEAAAAAAAAAIKP